MPRELPGLYWDEQRNRYFPLSARPASHNQPGPNAPPIHMTTIPPANETRHEPTSSTISVSRKRRRIPLPVGGLKSSSTYTQMRGASHNIMADSIASLSEGKPFWHGDFVFSSFDVSVQPDGSFVASTGDKGGWLQTYGTDKHGYPYGGSRELFLGAEVTAVCRSSTHRLAVSFGPSSKIAVENIADNAEICSIISIGDRRCRDIYTAHLRDKCLVLGAAQNGIVLSDIQGGWNYDVLPTNSDVLAVCQSQNLIYTGARNGSIQCFDKRLSSRQKGQELFEGRFRGGNRSITNLSVLNETQMLVSTMQGDLELLDLRFARKTEPLVTFQGHINAYTPNLGIATSPCLSYLFAAGQDQRIRAWSLLTGELISPTFQSPEKRGDKSVRLFNQLFRDPITAIQVTEGGGGGGESSNGLTLWAASGKTIHRYWLGQRLRGVSAY